MIAEETNKEIYSILCDSKYPEDTKKTYQKALLEMRKIDKNPDDNQKEILANHIKEMINRSNNKEKLDAIEPDLFKELSEESLNAAEEVVRFIGDIEPEEKYILAVHFEVANTK